MDEAVTPLTPALADHGVSIDWLAEAQHIAGLHDPSGKPPSVAEDVWKVNKFLRLVAAGNYKSTAAVAAGFTRQTLHNIEQRAKDGDIAAIALFDALEKAEGIAESGLVANVAKAAQKEQFWAAGMTLLERRHPEKWGRRQDSESGPKVVVQIGTTSPADVKVAILSPTVSPDMHRLTADNTSDCV